MSASPAFADGRHRGWGGGGWGGWRGHHDRGDDAGAIIAGLLLIGGIAAIANAASKADNQRRERPETRPDPRPEAPSRYGDPSRNDDWRSGLGLEDAVDQCVDEVERARHRVDTVDSVARQDDGWRVEGRADDGRAFSCTIDGDGRTRSVSVDGQAA